MLIRMLNILSNIEPELVEFLNNASIEFYGPAAVSNYPAIIAGKLLSNYGTSSNQYQDIDSRVERS